MPRLGGVEAPRRFIHYESWLRAMPVRVYYRPGRLNHMASLESVVHSDPEILGGTPVFRGTRVPVKNLLDYLAAGDSLDQFLDDFPSVTRDQAVAALEIARDLLTAGAHPAR